MCDDVPGVHTHTSLPPPSPSGLYRGRRRTRVHREGNAGTSFGRRRYPLHQAKLWFESAAYPVRIAYQSIPSNKRLFPDPNFPQTREISPRGKLRVKSTRTNLWGVVAGVEGETSCGQVTVQDWKAIACDWRSSGGTGVTSARPRYFSIRWRDKAT